MAEGRRKQQRMRRRVLSAVGLIALIFLLPAGVFLWGKHSSSFAVRKVEVVGGALTGQKAIEKQLHRSFFGTNLFVAGEEEVLQALKAFPYVKRVEVDRDFPSTLHVVVREHKPTAYVSSRKTWYVVANDGYVICELRRKTAAAPATAASASPSSTGAAAAAGTASAPAVTSPAASPSAAGPSGALPGAASTPAAAGATPAAGSVGAATATTTATGTAARLARLQAELSWVQRKLPCFTTSAAIAPKTVLKGANEKGVLTVIAALPASSRQRVAAVDVAKNGRCTLLFRDGLEVVWGDFTRSKAKALALRTVLEKYKSSGVTCAFVDVTIPDRVLARPVLK